MEDFPDVHKKYKTLYLTTENTQSFQVHMTHLQKLTM